MNEKENNLEWKCRSFSLKGFGSIFFHADGSYECIKERKEFDEITDKKEKEEFLDEFIKLSKNQSYYKPNNAHLFNSNKCIEEIVSALNEYNIKRGM